MYLPKVRQINIDGAYFGTSFPHAFLLHYPMAVIMPPKIYYYEPKIFGFKMHGKRGSAAFQPPKGHIRYIDDSMQSMELQQLRDGVSKISLKEKRPAPAQKPAAEDEQAQPVEGGNNKRRNKRKNKK